MRARSPVIAWSGRGLDPREHYPGREGRYPLHREPQPNKPSEAAFLALREGAKLYLVEAAGAGVRRLQARMADAVTLAALHGPSAVDEALGRAAVAGRFGDGDLQSILVHASASPPVTAPPAEHSLAAGTAMWSGLGVTDEEDQR